MVSSHGFKPWFPYMVSIWFPADEMSQHAEGVCRATSIKGSMSLADRNSASLPSCRERLQKWWSTNDDGLKLSA